MKPLRPAPSRRGRPPTSQADRARRILDAAEQVFTTTGYGAATMEAVAHAAGMSKKTLYELYPDKQRLFAAVIVAADDFPWEDNLRTPLADPRHELRHRLLASARFVLSPRQIRLTRLLIAEAAHAPELADDFHARVMAKCQTYLAAVLAQIVGEDVSSDDESVTRLAIVLLGAAFSELHLLALLGRFERPTDEQVASHVDTALSVCGFFASNRSGKRGSRQ
jgi:AcrR family transcriptional regulator